MPRIVRNTLLNYIPTDFATEQTINPLRIFELNNKPIRNGEIIYLCEREIRVKDNFALQFALQKSEELNLPLKIIHPKINYDYQQKQEFIDNQIEQAKTQFRNIGLDFEIIEKTPQEIIKTINPAILIIDFNPILKRDYLKNADFKIYEIDGHNIIPAKFVSKKQEYSAATLRIKIYHKENEGLAAARDDGMLRATGEYIGFVDSDDFVESVLLETIDTYLNKSNDIDVAIYTYNYYSQNKVFRESYRVAEDAFIWYGEAKNELFNKLIVSDAIDAIFIKAIRTDLLRNDPIDYADYYGKNMSEDVLQSIYPIIYADRIIYIATPLYNYRYNENSISHNYSSDSILKKDSSHVFKEILKASSLLSLDNDETKKRVYARWFSDVLYIFNKSCQHANDLKTWREILNTNWLIMLPDVGISFFQDFVNPFYFEKFHIIKSK